MNFVFNILWIICILTSNLPIDSSDSIYNPVIHLTLSVCAQPSQGKVVITPLSNVGIGKYSLWGDLPRANPAWETNRKLLGMEITLASLSLGLIPLIGSCGHKPPGWQGVSVWVLCFRVVSHVFLRHNSPHIPSMLHKAITHIHPFWTHSNFYSFYTFFFYTLFLGPKRNILL